MFDPTFLPDFYQNWILLKYLIRNEKLLNFDETPKNKKK